MLDTRFADQKLRACILAARAVPKPIQENPARSDHNTGKPALKSTLAGAETCGATIEWVSAQDVITNDQVDGITKGINRIETILRAASRHFKVPIPEILCKRVHADLVRPRHIAMYLSQDMTTMSYPDIGRRFNDRDHTTILSAVRKIRRLIQSDPQLAADVEAIRALAVKADPGMGQ